MESVLKFICRFYLLWHKFSAFPHSNETHLDTLPHDPLTKLGGIALRMVEYITEDDQEQLDMSKLSEFVTALSQATVTIKHPEVSFKHF